MLEILEISNEGRVVWIQYIVRFAREYRKTLLELLEDRHYPRAQRSTLYPSDFDLLQLVELEDRVEEPLYSLKSLDEGVEPLEHHVSVEVPSVRFSVGEESVQVVLVDFEE